MQVNNEIPSQSKDNFPNNNLSNTYPDIIEQVDKVINKYKNQLEQLKSKKDINESNIHTQYNNSSEMNQNKYPDIIKTSPDQYTTNTNNIQTAINIPTKSYNYTEIKEEINEYNEPNKNKYNFKYKLNELKNNPERKYYNKNNISDELMTEMENDNIKLGAALTSEKAKVVQMVNLLKEKENEINNLKKQIDNFDVKINEIENKYQNIINTIEQQQSIKINDIYNNMSDEKNKLKLDYNEIKRNNEVQLEQANSELTNNKKIIKIFFDLFNKNIDLVNKTEIFQGPKITPSNYTKDNAFLAVETLDKLINKLVQDNKDLFNELVRLKSEIDSNNIIMGQNNNFIQQENSSLKQLVQNLTHENNFLKNKSYKSLRNIENINNNYELPKNSKTQVNNREISSNNHRHIVHSLCRHCTPDCFRKSQNGEGNTSFEKIKLKINNLENQIRNQTYS